MLQLTVKSKQPVFAVIPITEDTQLIEMHMEGLIRKSLLELEFKNTSRNQARCCIPVVSAVWEADLGESSVPRV